MLASFFKVSMSIKYNSLISPETVYQMCAVASETPPGAFVEFGVYKGGSAYWLAKVAEIQDRELHLFDTFTGIPYAQDGDVHQIGDFSETSEKKVRELIPMAHFHVGIFPETMPDYLPKIAFLHIDADQYQSYVHAIRLFSPLMLKGGIMWFDDYNCLPAANKAIDEAFGDRVIKDEFHKAIVRF